MNNDDPKNLFAELQSAISASLLSPAASSSSSTEGGSNTSPLETITKLLEATRKGLEVNTGGIHNNPDSPNLLGAEDIGFRPSCAQTSFAIGGSDTHNLQLGGEAFFLDEAVLEEVEEDWKDGIPRAELERFGVVEGEQEDPDEDEGKDQGRGSEADQEEDNNEGARNRRKCGPNSKEGVRWRRRYRARRRAYLSNDPWIQRHAYWRPVGTPFTKYGLSPVECRLAAKILTLTLDHGSVSNANGCCVKTESILERFLKWASDTLASPRATAGGLGGTASTLLRILSCPIYKEDTNELEPELLIARIWKRIMCAKTDPSLYAASTPSPAALVSELNELFIYLQKNTGLSVGKLFGIWFNTWTGNGKISAYGACFPRNTDGINPTLPPVGSFFLSLPCCNGPCGCYVLPQTDRMAAVWKYWIARELVPDPCLDRLCGRIKHLLVQLLELCPPNKCKIRAYKYRDCCGNVRTLCARRPPDVPSAFLTIMLCDSQFRVTGLGPINVLGNELLCFLFGIIKRLVVYAPPPRLGCTFKGPCTTKACCSDPLCNCKGAGITNVCGGSCGGNSDCQRDPLSPFGSYGYWNCRKRKEFHEAEAKDKERQTEEDGGRTRAGSSFEEVAARLRAAICEQNKEEVHKEEEVSTTDDDGGSRIKRDAEDNEQKDETSDSKKRVRKAPLPSRRVVEAIPRGDKPLPPPKGVTLDDLPLEAEMKDVVKYVDLLKQSLDMMGVFEDLTVQAVLGALMNEWKKINQVMTNDLVNPDRKALADCYNNPQAVSSASGLMGIAPFLHTLFCVPEVRVLDFVIQPLKQLLVEIIDCNPCGQAMPASQCQEIYNVFEVLVLGIASG